MTSWNLEGLRLAGSSFQGDRAGSCCKNIGEHAIIDRLPVRWLSDTVTARVGIVRMGSSSQVDLIFGNGGPLAGFKRIGEVLSEAEDGGVVEAIDPCLRVRLIGANGANVRGFAVVVPGEDLKQVEQVAVVDESLPSESIAAPVRVVKPLSTNEVRSDTR